MTTAPCPHLVDPPAIREVVRLWDGRDHCAACIEEVCPGLSEFARGRDHLEDSIAFDRTGGLIAWGKYVGLFFGVLALVGVGCLAVVDASTTFLLIGACGAVLSVSVFAILPSAFKARWTLPTTRVSGGVVEVYRASHDGGIRPVVSYPLLEARWHLGRVREDSSCRERGGALVTDRPAVVLLAPRRWKGVAPPSEFTATGSSPEMIRLWRGFLRLAGVPEGK